MRGFFRGGIPDNYQIFYEVWGKGLAKPRVIIKYFIVIFFGFMVRCGTAPIEIRVVIGIVQGLFFRFTDLIGEVFHA